MRKSRLWRVLASAALAALMASAGRTLVAEGSTLKPTYLKGLQRVSLITFVDRGLEGHALLEGELQATAQRALGDEGISTEGSQASTLSVQVKTHPASEDVAPNSVLIQVSVQLNEHVLLVRDPSRKVPGGISAVVWSRESISIASKAAVRQSITADVDLLVGLFAADVKAANE